MSSVSTAAIPKAHPYRLGSLKCPFGHNPYRVCTEPLGPSQRDASAAQFSEAHFGLQRSQSSRAPMNATNRKSKDRHSKQKQQQYCGTSPIVLTASIPRTLWATFPTATECLRYRCADCSKPLFLSFPPRFLLEVFAKKSDPLGPVYAQRDPSLLLSPHTMDAVPHLHDAKEEQERLSPSPPREATVQPGEEEVRAQRGSGCSELRQNRRRVLCVALCAVPCILVSALVAVIVLQRPSCSPRPPFSHVCPNTSIGFQGKCYYFSDVESDWNSSREHCHRLGASLATIETEEEMEFMLRYRGPANCWIGLHRAEGAEHWTWADGSAFSNWFELRGGGRCAYLNGDRISSALCHNEKFWVCSTADSYVRWRKGTNPQ